MLSSDIYAILQWWLTIFLIGTSFLPLTINLFKSFFDRGYLFSKIIGTVILSYLVFIFGLAHIISFNRTSAVIILLIFACLIWTYYKRQNIFTVIKQHWKIFVFEELFFFAALFFWAFIHSFAPDVHGLEKYMDYGFINSILRSDYFPPKDMWFSPYFINYYYFGHLITAVLTKISGLPSNITFNLMLSTIFAFCFTESFSIAANLYTFLGEKIKFFRIKRITAGLIGAILTTLAGNLHIIYGFFKAYPNDMPVPPWQLQFLPFSFPNGYWYPNATRFIYHTIHEFPIYSWVVADLHGHVLDIPIVLLIIAFLLSFFITKSQKISAVKNKTQAKINLLNHWKMELGSLLIISFLLAVAYMTNAWDGAIYLLLSAFIITYLYSIKKKGYTAIALSIVTIIGGFIVFTFPYNLNFKPFVGGIGILCSPDFLIAKHNIGPLLFEADHCQHSPWWQLLILYGFFYFFIASFMIFISNVKKIFNIDQFILLLILLSTILIILPEFIYVKDIYPAHYRANTMFKLVFQAFIMLSLSSGYIIVRILTTTKRKLYALSYAPFALIFISLVMIYPYMAINSYYGNLKAYHSLDGTSYLKTLYPSDEEAIEWINKNIKGQPVILEAQGDSYTDYARISSNTGLPTILGWTVHEWLWRGTYDIPAPRIGEIKTLYETEDEKLTTDLLKKYKVQYVFIGGLETEKYPKLSENKFKQLGKLVFQKDNTKIYQITF